MSLITPNSSELKFKRIDSNPNNGNKLMDRPVASSEKFLYPPDLIIVKQIYQIVNLIIYLNQLLIIFG